MISINGSFSYFPISRVHHQFFEVKVDISAALNNSTYAIDRWVQRVVGSLEQLTSFEIMGISLLSNMFRMTCWLAFRF